MHWNSPRILIFGLSLATAVFSGDKVAAELKTMPATDDIDVIVRFHPGAASASGARISARGAKKVADLGVIQSAVYRMRAGDAVALDGDPGVAGVQPNRRVLGLEFTGSPDYGWRTALGTAVAMPYD